MCTVSIVARPDGLRLVANRDEQRSRAIALPPRVVDRGGVRVLMPIDSSSGGTWVAVNDLGVALALLNVNPAAPFPPGMRSRGDIVASLAPLASIEEVERSIARVDARQYSPFKVICAAGGRAVELAPHSALVRRYALDPPLMFTSSGLGDDRVELPRRRLFEELVGGGRRGCAGDLSGRQDAFHAHRWSEAPDVSVFMSRGDALTVSRTVIEIRGERVDMTYAGAPDWVSSTLTMTRGRSRQRAERSR